MMISTTILFFLLVSSSTWINKYCSAQQPLIYDTDHGPFIDDIFALGLLLNSYDLVDMQLILGTSEQPELSATCIAAQIKLSGMEGTVPVAMGEELPPYEDRGSVCGIPGILGFGIEPACRAAFNETDPADIIEDGVAYAANLILESERDDWWYLVVGGQTSLKRLIEEFPEAASKIDTLVVMAGNWCADFEPYPDVMAPTDETNIGCDPQAANFVLDGNNIVFNNVYYVPVEVADAIGGDDYAIFVEAAESGTQPVAAATLEFYKLWSEASRADESLLVHLEAMTYDPETESTPQFDAMAVMLVLELLSSEQVCGDDGRFFKNEFEAVHFYENDDPGLQPFPEAPRSAFSLFSGTVDSTTLPDQCPNITEFTFDPDDTPEAEYPIMVTLGFHSSDAKSAVFSDMARRMAGEIVLCEDADTVDSPTTTVDSPTAATVDDEGTSPPSATESVFGRRWIVSIVLLAVATVHLIV